MLIWYFKPLLNQCHYIYFYIFIFCMGWESNNNTPWKIIIRVLWLCLTHWGRVTHICVSNLNIIGSDNGLSPVRCQAIIRTNAAILLVWHLGTNFSEIWMEIDISSFKKMHFKMSSAKWRPSCLGLIVRTGQVLWRPNQRCSMKLNI